MPINPGDLTKDMSKDQETIARSFIRDTVNQNLKKLNDIFNESAASREIRDRFKKTELPVIITPQLLKILDDSTKYNDHWPIVSDKDSVYNNMHNQVREMLISGSKAFKDKEAMLLGLQKSFFLENRSWQEWETMPIDNIAKELRDTIGIAMPKLHEDIKRDLTNRSDLKPLLELIDWDNFLGVGKATEAIVQYSLNTGCQYPDPLVHQLINATAALSSALSYATKATEPSNARYPSASNQIAHSIL
ncbi:MAG: hypothetical protein ACMZI2_00225 [Candidatus Symbiodolus clandestinus]